MKIIKQQNDMKRWINEYKPQPSTHIDDHIFFMQNMKGWGILDSPPAKNTHPQLPNRITYRFMSLTRVLLAARKENLFSWANNLTIY
ncbi:hypothetical protein E1A91_D08G198600v1 [Gossypium mustelinum]|uniref:Uncharacterized protein n=2 Tax=Gossypium TaxID=3633 RepID=A0A5J5QHB1_GOSBA|nr:hypothetical protein ES319_D08G196900v1 [Gossypium barbadense]TYI70105.1 hypothetical protein E1A91_D08G198600v1 [Gossypium mustelinum]